MQVDRRAVRNFDWLLFSLVLFAATAGVLTIFSATRPLEGMPHPNFYIKQIIWTVAGIGAMLLTIKIDYRRLERFAVALYMMGLLLLVFVLVRGRMGMGAQRWISLGGISFQPSEVFKLVYIIMLARYFSMVEAPLDTRRFMKMLPFLAFLPFLLLVKQPDLGTAAAMCMVFLFLCIARGMSKKLVAALLIFGIVSAPFLWNIFWNRFLKGYQRDRIVAFLDPGADTSGIGYNINQSKIAIGSGMVLGKGYLKGTQGPFRFLPENHTDFIFSVFAEEWGFAGCLVLLAVYLAILLRALDTARQAKDEFGGMLALGVAFMFAIYFFLNIGMAMGMMPVVGIPLPFMSYGGTAVLSNYVAVGLLINVRMRRFELFY
ncbi:MAG: rod shape-determining protein RodA [Nitrospiraceae bacterium]|nr:rod shape-determining protein RodA [Nitrospiraceae bacterium]